MIKELDTVVLNVDLPEYRLEKGDIGTVVLIHQNHKGYEVEFITLEGETLVVISLFPSQIRPVQKREITHLTMKEPWASGNKNHSRLKARKKLAIHQFSNLLCDGRPGIIASTSAMLTRLNCILSFSGVTINIFMIVKLIGLYLHPPRIWSADRLRPRC